MVCKAGVYVLDDSTRGQLAGGVKETMEYIDFAGVAALVLAFVAVWKAWKGTVPEKADAMQKYQEMLDKAATDCQKLRKDVSGLQDENVDLKLRIRKLETCVDKYRLAVSRLIKQLEAHGIEPAWRPPDD